MDNVDYDGRAMALTNRDASMYTTACINQGIVPEDLFLFERGLVDIEHAQREEDRFIEMDSRYELCSATQKSPARSRERLARDGTWD